MLSVANIKRNDGYSQSQQLSPGKEYLEVLFLKIFLREPPPAAAADLGSKHISHLAVSMPSLKTGQHQNMIQPGYTANQSEGSSWDWLGSRRELTCLIWETYTLHIQLGSRNCS